MSINVPRWFNGYVCGQYVDKGVWFLNLFFFLISIKKQRLEMPNLIVEVSNCLIMFGKHRNMEEFEWQTQTLPNMSRGEPNVAGSKWI